MSVQVRSYFIEHAVTAVGADALPSRMALNYLHRHGDVPPRFITRRGQAEAYEDAYRPADRDTVLATVGRADPDFPHAAASGVTAGSGC
ncbi:hypothetical protein ACQEVC_20670 [Plantactinospora sp. CA-294935]|uniref:hypothetical protein n=1 Tax=Plantactinospora sp. CA-294935 TaxID=3240012 RepID=UPI003D909178